MRIRRAILGCLRRLIGTKIGITSAVTHVVVYNKIYSNAFTSRRAISFSLVPFISICFTATGVPAYVPKCTVPKPPHPIRRVVVSNDIFASMSVSTLEFPRSGLHTSKYDTLTHIQITK